jgi:hypothetical protein
LGINNRGQKKSRKQLNGRSRRSFRQDERILPPPLTATYHPVTLKTQDEVTTFGGGERWEADQSDETDVGPVMNPQSPWG